MTERTPPVFVKHPVGRILKEGVKFTLECRVTGTPTPDISWTLDGKPIKAVHTVKQEGDTSTLEIEAVTPEDTGSYRCLAKSVAGEARSVGHLIVKPAGQDKLPGPIFVGLPQSETVRAGNQMILDCEFDTGTAKFVAWERDGRGLDRTEFDESADSSICRLVDLSVKRDTGIYKVIATAKDGKKATWTFALQVLPPPPKPPADED